jgi:hypothetical protein
MDAYKQAIAEDLERQAAAVIERASRHGFVLTIELVPLRPLAMRNHRPVVNVRPVLERD